LNYRIRRLTPVPVEPPPQLPDEPIINAIDGSRRLAPGSLFRIRGTNLTSGNPTSAEAPLPAKLSDTEVLINDVAAPLAALSATEITGQLPFETSTGEARLRVRVKEQSSVEVRFTVTPAAPALLTSGGNQALAIREDGSIVSTENPAAAGSDVRVYFTGQGAVEPAVASGLPGPADPLSRPVARVQVWLGDIEAEVLDVILLPGFAGITELRLRVPTELSSAEYEIRLVVGGEPSNTLLVPVGASQAASWKACCQP
jgi:uncharacterized protein (TIGR03437 family)